MKTKKTAEQKKADKAFIAKIGTLGINTGGGKLKCADCGTEYEPVGALVGTINGKDVSGPVFGYRRPPKHDDSNERGFSA